MITFQNMNLPEALLHKLEHMKFNEPTEIQAESIPVALQGKDILGSAQTGTGKTGAFGIPLVANILSGRSKLALVMAPTRELATQVVNQIQAMLSKKTGIKTALLIGGEPIPKQFRLLRNKPQIIVGTPGRINDHLQRGTLDLRNTDFLVLDETDRMLDMGFSIQIENILKHMHSKQRQTLLFSATLPNNIMSITKKYLNNPVRISVSAPSSPAANIQQDIIRTRESDKYSNLLAKLDEKEGSIIIFVKTKHGAERMAAKISKDGHSADAIHGDLKQSRRGRVISAFRNQKYRILVATDVAARGLDIPHIEHVINYDLPQCAEDYVHRIGRTARAGASGTALNFITPSDRNRWSVIESLINPDASKSKSSAKPANPKNKRPRRRSFNSNKSNKKYA